MPETLKYIIIAAAGCVCVYCCIGYTVYSVRSKRKLYSQENVIQIGNRMSKKEKGLVTPRKRINNEKP